MSQCRHDPSLDYANTVFYLGFVFRSTWSGGHNTEAVMICKVGIRPVQVRIVQACLCNSTLEIIWNCCAGNALIVFKGSHMAHGPTSDCLALLCFRIQILT